MTARCLPEEPVFSHSSERDVWERLRDCLPGDVLALLDGTVVQVGAELDWVARRLLDRLLPGAELVTLVLGEDAPPGLGDALVAALRMHL